MQTSILIVEDEEDLRDLMIYHFKREGYSVSSTESGESGLKLATQHVPDLLILDIMLPGMSGLDVCRALKSKTETQHIPIIFVSAKGEETDIVVGLEMGADDYVPKPFSPKVLLARAKSVLRRGGQADQPAPSEHYVEGLYLDSDKRYVTIDKTPLHLTPSEFSILQFLLEHRGWVFTRYQIVNAIRGEQYIVTERAVDVQIAGLRNKLGHLAHLIETVRGVGYRFKNT